MKYNNSEIIKIKVLIIAKLLQHTEPIRAVDIAEYINNNNFGMRKEVTPNYISHLIRKHNNNHNYMNQIEIIKRWKGNTHAYRIKERQS